MDSFKFIEIISSSTILVRSFCIRGDDGDQRWWPALLGMHKFVCSDNEHEYVAGAKIVSLESMIFFSLLRIEYP